MALDARADDDEEADDEERADAALYDDERALATHVVRVTLRVHSVEKDANGVERLAATVRARVKAMTWTRARAMSVTHVESCVADEASGAMTMDACVAWRCRACSSEEARLARRLRSGLEAVAREFEGAFEVEDVDIEMTAPGYVPLGSFEVTTARDLDCSSTADAARRFDEEGVATCLTRVDSERVSAIRGAVDAYISKIERRFAEAHTEISYGSDRFAFKEIGSRGGERFDALVDLEREEWASLRALAKTDAPWLPFVRDLMSNSWNVNVSVVYSKPGAKNQEWHADGRHLDAECDPRTGLGHAPPYGVCVFMPLIDLNAATGFTQFFMRSHKTSQLIGFGEAVATLRLSFDGVLEAGQSVLYDYRLLHRGMANNTTNTVRPVLQFLYTVPAYKELRNYGVESLW